MHRKGVAKMSTNDAMNKQSIGIDGLDQQGQGGDQVCNKRFWMIANWKNQGTAQQLEQTLADLKEMDASALQLAILLPAPLLALWPQHGLSNVYLGAQNIEARTDITLTGAYGVQMIKDRGCSLVCIGHSERRKYCLESEDDVVQQCCATIKSGLIPLVCIGEDSAAQADPVVERQLQYQLQSIFKAVSLAGVDSCDIIVAYEPMWAVGSQASASADLVEQRLEMLRHSINAFSQEYPRVRFSWCYGGSVNASNIRDLYCSAWVDGVLIGRASHDRRVLMEMIELCKPY